MNGPFLHARGYYASLVIGTILFLLWLLFPIVTGDGGRWTVQDYLVTATTPNPRRDTLQAQYEAVFAKQAVVKLSLYIAFVVVVAGHAVLWRARGVGADRPIQPFQPAGAASTGPAGDT
jgi:hypothetical protein